MKNINDRNRKLKSEVEKNNKIRILQIIKKLSIEFPNARTELVFSNPLQLLISTILSAQCTDKRVNIVTPVLFKKYRTAIDFSKANKRELENMIKSTGFYKTKAKYIIQACKILVERFNGKVPNNMESLLSLPGVGRKTANCVLGGAYGIQSGIVVDTHTARLSKMLSLSKENDPDKIEKDLMKIVPRNAWYYFSNLLILHGRKICRARKPICDKCILIKECPSAFIFSKLH